MRYLLLLVLLLFVSPALAATQPVDCAADGAHANVYNTALNKWSCVSISGGSGSTTTLGSATTANPQISGSPTSGFYTPGANQITVESNAVKVEQWETIASGTDFLDVTPGKSGTALNFTVTGSANAAFLLATQGAGNITLTPGSTGEVVVSSGALNIVSASSGLALNGNNGISVPSIDNTSLAIGTSALAALATATSNDTAVGFQALKSYQGVTNGGNVAVGDSALSSDLTGFRNVAVGYFAMVNATASTDIAIGWKALQGDVGTGANIGIGFTSLQNTTTGTGNIVLGNAAGQWITTGFNNVAVGSSALLASTANNLTGNNNTAVGLSSGANIKTGSGNTALGSRALGGSTTNSNTGNNNTTVGYMSLSGAINGATTNVALGYNSGSSITTGSTNVIIGPNVASTTLTTGSSNILIGTSNAVDATTSTSSSQLDIGNTIYGNLSSGLVSIGTSSQQAGYSVTAASGVYSTQTSSSNAAISGMNTAVSGTGYGGYFIAATTGSGYGVYGSETGSANTGYAGYFLNTSTATSAYAVQADGQLGVKSALNFTSTTAIKPVNGLYSPAANTLALTSSGNTALATTSSGWVRIQTSNATHPLDVGNFNASDGESIDIASSATFGAGFGIDSSSVAGGNHWQFSASTNANNSCTGCFQFFNETTATVGMGITATSSQNNVWLLNFGVFGWANTTQFISPTLDTGMSRDSAGVVDIGTGTQGNKAGSVNLKNLTATGVIALGGFTVSTLPAGVKGQTAYVSDAVACTFLGTLTGGGTTACPVFYNGTAWVGY